MNNDIATEIVGEVEPEDSNLNKSRILSNKVIPLPSPEITEISIQDLVDNMQTGALRVSRRYQRTFAKDKEWSANLITSTVNGHVPSFDNMYVHARNDDCDDLMDGLHRLSTYTWFIIGFIYPIGHKKHGTQHRDFLRLPKDTIWVSKDGTQIDVGGMTWPQIKKNKEFHGEILKHFENRLLHQKYKIVRYRKLTEAQVFTLFRQIADRFPFTDQQWRNAYSSDCAECVKIFTIKEYVYDISTATVKFHPIFELENGKPKYISRTVNLKNENVQQWCLEQAYILEEWDSEEFDSGSSKLNQINTQYDEPGSFKKKFIKLEKYLSFLERVATNGGTVGINRNPMLFATDKPKNIIGGSRLSVFIAVMWDYVLNNVRFEKDGVKWKYQITSDDGLTKTTSECPSLRFYNYLLSIYAERSTVTAENPGIGVLNETKFRNAVRKGTLSKKEWVNPVIEEISPLVDKLNSMTESELSDKGLRRVDSKGSKFTDDQKANAWREHVVVQSNMSIPFPCLDADHVIPFSKGGTTSDDNLELIPAGINRSKGNKTE